MASPNSTLLNKPTPSDHHITYMSPDGVQLNAKNPRIHSKKQIDQIAASIRQFGFLVPVIVDASLRLICGHGRVLAARKLSLTQIPVIRVEHLSEAEVKAFMIADNQLTLNATWDERLLGDLLLDLSQVELDFNLDIIGMPMAEIDLYIEGLNEAPDDRADELPDVPDAPPITQLGDLWLLGPHRVLCGSALESDSFKRLLGPDKADIIFTDPPYNVPIQGHVSGLGQSTHREFAMASGEMTAAQFQTFLETSCALMAEASRDGALNYICMDWRHIEALLAAGAKIYDDLKNICVWAKDNGGMGSLYRSQHEFICVFKQGKAAHTNNIELGKHGRYRTNVWTYPCANTFSRQSDEGNLLALHPTVKPVKMVADALLDASARGDLVLDPYLGSGTTLMAAERVGRRAAGIELDPIYVDLIIRRWQDYTGGTAILAANGQSFNAIMAGKAVAHG